MVGSLLERIERAASRLGHEIAWDIVGVHLAHGHCLQCENAIVVSAGRHEPAASMATEVEGVCRRFRNSFSARSGRAA